MGVIPIIFNTPLAEHGQFFTRGMRKNRFLPYICILKFLNASPIERHFRPCHPEFRLFGGSCGKAYGRKEELRATLV